MSLRPDEMALRAVVWRSLVESIGGEIVLQRVTLKTLFLPGPNISHLSTSVTIYPSKYDLMIILV